MRTATVMALLPLLVQAQSGGLPSDWQTVKALAAGSRVKVTMAGGKTATGELSGVDDQGLRLAKGGNTLKIEKDQISRLHRMVRGSRTRPILIGAAVGGGIGAAAGTGLYRKADFEKTVISGVAIIGAGLGALIGLVASTRHTEQLVYAAYPPAGR